jgi:hypothetical protein
MTTQTDVHTARPDLPKEQDAKEAEHQRLAALGKQALAAFWRDLAELMKDHHRQWAAYQGAVCLGIGQTREELWWECERRGLKPGEFLICYIDYQDPDLVAAFDEPVSPLAPQ